MRKVLSRTIIVGQLIFSACALARPIVNIDPGHHPNLASAQQLTAQAWDYVGRAQQANQFEVGGHAARAKELLEEVNRELRLAADVSNANGR
jgi:hypothetical protein